MQNKSPTPDVIFPIHGVNITYIKPSITSPNIIVGDFTYFADKDFEAHVTHHYDFIGDKLIIGKFCQIAAGVEFVMNGANHQMNAIHYISVLHIRQLESWHAHKITATHQGRYCNQ